MVRHDFHCNDLPRMFGRDAFYDALQASPDFAREQLPPVLRAPYEMEIEKRYRCPLVPIFYNTSNIIDIYKIIGRFIP